MCATHRLQFAFASMNFHDVCYKKVQYYFAVAMLYCVLNCAVTKKLFSIASTFITITTAVKIDKLLVPEVVQSGSPSGAVLDCQFSAEDLYTVQWFFNHSEAPIYQWRPGEEPTVNSFLDGKLDLSSRGAGRRSLHIMNLEPGLSGDYTCRVSSDSSSELPDNLTKPMLVYSTEKDFMLLFHQQLNVIEVKCIARGLYPQPDLTIELNRSPYPKQQQRVWRSDGLLYDAECTAVLPVAVVSNPEVTCRLQLPQAGYTAIKRELLLNPKKQSNCSSPRFVSPSYHSLVIITTVICKYLH